VLGRELIQFSHVTPLGAGRFRLSRLLRGRGGTEWAADGHGDDDPFCLILPGRLQAVAMRAWTIGAEVSAIGGDGASGPIRFQGEAVRPPAPVALKAHRNTGGGLELSWIRRSRSGFAWIDGVDAPLGETREQYRIFVTGAETLERETTEPSVVFSAADVATLGSGPALIKVSQIGDFAASHPAQLTINLA
jgi:hypothetical protein